MMGVAGCLDQNKVEYNWMLRFGRLYSNWRITFAESVPRTIEVSIKTPDREPLTARKDEQYARVLE